MNIVIVKGTLLDDPAERVLADGRRVSSGTILIQDETGKRESVPYSWFDAPDSASGLDGGSAVVATGRMSRRFFRASGRTESLTDLIVTRMVRAHHRRRVATAVRNALEPAERLTVL